MKKDRILFMIIFALFVMLPFSVNANETTGGEIDESSIVESDMNVELEDTSVNVVLNANGGLFTDKEEYVLEDIYGDSEIIYPTREGYIFKGYYTEKDGGLYLDYYTEEHVVENGMIFYAHWDEVGTTTIDFTKIINCDNLNSLENSLLDFIIDNEILLEEESDKTFRNVNGKVLFKVSDNYDIILQDGLTSSDNIVYNLSSAEKQNIINDNSSLDYVPDVVKLIFANEYKVIFDANEGTFKSGKILTIDKWENGLEDSLEEPTREGYKFLGFFTEKTGGTKLELILAESGIDSDRTFYAHWEESSSIMQEDNPKTFDNISIYILIGTVSIIGLVSVIIYLKRQNKSLN